MSLFASSTASFFFRVSQLHEHLSLGHHVAFLDQYGLDDFLQDGR